MQILKVLFIIVFMFVNHSRKPLVPVDWYEENAEVEKMYAQSTLFIDLKRNWKI